MRHRVLVESSIPSGLYTASDYPTDHKINCGSFNLYFNKDNNASRLHTAYINANGMRRSDATFLIFDTIEKKDKFFSNIASKLGHFSNALNVDEDGFMDVRLESTIMNKSIITSNIMTHLHKTNAEFAGVSSNKERFKMVGIPPNYVWISLKSNTPSMMDEMLGIITSNSIGKAYKITNDDTQHHDAFYIDAYDVELLKLLYLVYGKNIDVKYAELFPVFISEIIQTEFRALISEN